MLVEGFGLRALLVTDDALQIPDEPVRVAKYPGHCERTGLA